MTLAEGSEWVTIEDLTPVSRLRTSALVSWESGYAHVVFDEQFGIVQITLDCPTQKLLTRVPLARIANALRAGRPAENRIRLARPRKRRLPCEFFAEVAAAYRDAVARGMKPRKTLSEDTGAADATVARWIGEARKRGELPAALPGRVSV